mgnify:CR=1 FL=1
MKFIILVIWIVSLAMLAYVPWKWTWRNTAGSTQVYAGYAWIWEPPASPIALGIGWITEFDIERWLVQMFIIFAIFVLSSFLFKKR